MKHLSSYVLGPKQMTDGHLLGLAKVGDMRLATLNEGIFGAFSFT